jgi:hypothetical protein
MTIEDFLSKINKKEPPAQESSVTGFERTVGHSLPKDYRDFLIQCNGGHVGGRLWFKGPTPNGDSADAGIHHIGGFRNESYFSLGQKHVTYQVNNLWIPKDLIWIMDDPFGNAICLGISEKYRGQVYFWDHENISKEDEWDGRVESARNLQLLSNTFGEFIAGLKERKRN